MQKLVIAVITVIIAYLLFLLAALRFFPLLIAVPLLFISILAAVYSLNERSRFKGFNR